MRPFEWRNETIASSVDHAIELGEKFLVETRSGKCGVHPNTRQFQNRHTQDTAATQHLQASDFFAFQPWIKIVWGWVQMAGARGRFIVVPLSENGMLRLPVLLVGRHTRLPFGGHD
jgi:hypothetical protein